MQNAMQDVQPRSRHYAPDKACTISQNKSDFNCSLARREKEKRKKTSIVGTRDTQAVLQLNCGPLRRRCDQFSRNLGAQRQVRTERERPRSPVSTSQPSVASPQIFASRGVAPPVGGLLRQRWELRMSRPPRLTKPRFRDVIGLE